ncbi:MAG: hypothetical protein JO364_00540 [Pseudonocardiales bacterium]|nr:hypothetical protein [Pseudonocardiales bacterium]
MREPTRAAVLPLLVLATTSGVAGLEMMAASSAMAEPGGQGGGSDPGSGSPAAPTDPVTGLVGALTGSSSTPAH